MFPGMNQKALEQAMKKLGIKQEEIEAREVIIKGVEKDYIIRNPKVSKVNAMGQESIQVIGDLEEYSGISDDDVKMVMEAVKCSESEARESLEKNNGDIAKTILELSK